MSSAEGEKRINRKRLEHLERIQQKKQSKFTKTKQKKLARIVERKKQKQTRDSLVAQLLEYQLNESCMQGLVSTAKMQQKLPGTVLTSENINQPVVFPKKLRCISGKDMKASQQVERKQNNYYETDSSSDDEEMTEICNKTNKEAEGAQIKEEVRDEHDTISDEAMEINKSDSIGHITQPAAGILNQEETENQRKLALEKANAFFTALSKIKGNSIAVPRMDKIELQRRLLPIHAEEQQIVEAIIENTVVVISGETGSGKSSQIPQFLYEAGFTSNDHLIVVTEPRRIAAISMSERVGYELNNSSLSSYQIRFEGNRTDATRILFMTDGVLLRELQADVTLSKFSVVIIDEAHERNIRPEMDCDIAGYHVESFNYLTDEGLHSAAVDVPTVKLRLPHGDAVEFSYTSARLGYPALENTNKIGQNLELTKIYPSECRQRGLTYATTLSATIDFSVNGKKIDSIETVIGEVPVMLMSKHCNLHGFNREQLIRHGEEGNERGGYFVVNGSEKVVRLLVANKRNFPLAIQRASHRDKGQLFSDSAVMMRCVRGNFAAAAINLHYLESASITMSLQYRRELFYVPLMYVLRALTDMNDAMIYEHLTRGRPGDTFWANCVTNMLVTAQEEGVVSQQAACVALGTRFRVALGNMIAPWEPDEAAAHYLLKYCVAIHLDTNEEKFFCLALMAHKLIALVKNEITSESLDNPQFQEASVSGHIMLLLIREKMENILTSARSNLEKSANKRTDTFTMNNNEMLKALKVGELTHHLRNFLSTGNLKTNNGLGLMQTNGFSVIAERINYLRFVSHFRAIHRGAFFTEMRTTDVRKLRPEAWGFICPVHTPDGAPCGLLNHITATCRIVTHYSVTRKIEATLTSLGMLPHKLCTLVKSESLFPVIVDGNFLGYIPREKASQIERQLRGIKVNKDDDRIPYITEITLIRHSPDPANVMTQFPGLYLYTSPGRMIRPVYNLLYQVREYIGIFEQVYLSIIIDPEEAEPGVTIHQELHPSALFSFAGNLIPFPDHNQSPRNVYQCQMGKQTMGVPVHAWRHRADNKMYLLQTPQKPLLKLESHDIYEMDEYPLGTNACVAVISYTGYDMEDAMVINKSSYQRGFAHGGVIKVERINLAENKRQGFGKGVPDEFFFGDMEKLPSTITEDGLPIPGRLYRKDDIYYSTFDTVSGKFKTYKFKSEEPAYCLLVRIVDEGQVKQKVHALIQWRITRNPIIGDKFASRHGQKGINSFLWPAESLPFSDSGMVPDIIFNPHGFPSRMTIGMMIESMAGKAAAMHGTSYDASPFVFNEENTAIDHFGKLLQKAGFNHHGNETLYSGINGKEMEVQIFFGIVYYQRLRHMIADKFQVRATGPVDPVTLQPVKGRKMGGGIRFGEMERDALIAHGTAFCLQDRLFNCSDKDEAYMCASCGSLVSVAQLRPHMAISRKIESAFHKHNATIKDTNFHNAMKRHCTVCKRDDQVFLVQVPRVFRYLCAELSSVNVKVQLRINHPKNLKH